MINRLLKYHLPVFIVYALLSLVAFVVYAEFVRGDYKIVTTDILFGMFLASVSELSKKIIDVFKK